jgi:hypothetical protein
MSVVIIDRHYKKIIGVTINCFSSSVSEVGLIERRIFLLPNCIKKECLPRKHQKCV